MLLLNVIFDLTSMDTLCFVYFPIPFYVSWLIRKWCKVTLIDLICRSCFISESVCSWVCVTKLNYSDVLLLMVLKEGKSLWICDWRSGGRLPTASEVRKRNQLPCIWGEGILLHSTSHTLKHALTYKCCYNICLPRKAVNFAELVH